MDDQFVIVLESQDNHFKKTTCGIKPQAQFPVRPVIVFKM
jgi:hypothetical protein